MSRSLLRLLACITFASMASAQESAPPPKPWTGSLGAGLAVTSGNSDTRNVNFAFNSAWDPKTDRTFKADAIYLRGESNGEKQVDKATASARFERNVSSRTFWFAETTWLRDPFKDITYLVSPLAGGGIRLVDTETRKLLVDGSAGAALSSSRELGQETSGALKAGQAFEWNLSPSSRFTQRLSGLWKTDDFADALYHFDAGLAMTIVSRAELKLSWVYDYANRPPAADVEKGDSALFATLLFKF
jgi:putative salt-induced outer membrane protein YdiY